MLGWPKPAVFYNFLNFTAKGKINTLLNKTSYRLGEPPDLPAPPGGGRVSVEELLEFKGGMADKMKGACVAVHWERNGWCIGTVSDTVTTETDNPRKKIPDLSSRGVTSSTTKHLNFSVKFSDGLFDVALYMINCLQANKTANPPDSSWFFVQPTGLHQLPAGARLSAPPLPTQIGRPSNGARLKPVAGPGSAPKAKKRRRQA